jgi:phenylpropionate dioxygenase-like ring-hydroxylating dioxygenase large terminal subunit
MIFPPELDHWHPVFLSRKLGKRPVSVKICDFELVLFRTTDGVAALLDRCPHRAMRLSKGRVKNDCIECPYHGWQFDAEGAGTSPGTPKMKPTTTHLSCAEKNGAIWVKNPRSSAQIPWPDIGSFHLSSVHRHRFPAPLELVMDNFHEAEHTATVHTFLGADLARMHEAEVHIEAEQGWVRETTRVPQKPVPRLVTSLFGVHGGDTFVDMTTTWFAPCHSVFDLHWEDPQSGEHRPEHVRSVTFFTPVDAHNTDVFAFAYLKEPTTGRFGLNRLVALANRVALDIEFSQDIKTLRGLADYSTNLSDLRLGRFDKALVELRRGVRRYRGQTGLPVLDNDAAAEAE